MSYELDKKEFGIKKYIIYYDNDTRDEVELPGGHNMIKHLRIRNYADLSAVLAHKKIKCIYDFESNSMI